MLIFLVLISSASASVELQWTDGVSGKLQRGEVIAYKNYSVKVVAFPLPVEADKYSETPGEPVETFVGLNVSKDDTFIDTIILRPSESYILPDSEMRVTAKELPSKSAKEWLFESYAPWAVIELNPRGIPGLEVLIETDKDKYIFSSTADIVATVKLENIGTADAVNVDMNIETELPVKRGSLKYHYDRINKGNSTTEQIVFESPALSEQKMYSISVNVSGYDVKDILYSAKFRKSISAAAEPQRGLSIRKSTVNKMYLKDYTLVSLSVKNNGKNNFKNVSIIDSLPGGFKLMGNHSLNWTVDIPANGEWNYIYLVRPHEPSKEGIVFPPATAEFKIKNELYNIQSNQPKIVVYGAKVVLKKQTDVTEVNPGDVVTVTLIAENTGNAPTKVVIMDNLPEDVTMVNGSTTHEEFLEANKKINFSYAFRIDSPPIKLPPATADYYELGTVGRNISTTSEEIEINIKPLIIATPTPAPTVVEPQQNYTDSSSDVVEPQQNSTNSSAVNEPDKTSGKSSTFLDFLISIITAAVKSPSNSTNLSNVNRTDEYISDESMQNSANSSDEFYIFLNDIMDCDSDSNSDNLSEKLLYCRKR